MIKGPDPELDFRITLVILDQIEPKFLHILVAVCNLSTARDAQLKILTFKTMEKNCMAYSIFAIIAVK
jgi:hypothetical protein